MSKHAIDFLPTLLKYKTSWDSNGALRKSDFYHSFSEGRDSLVARLKSVMNLINLSTEQGFSPMAERVPPSAPKR